MATVTTEQNTDLARRLGLLTGSEVAGTGLVQQRLATADPSIIKQYEQGISQITGQPFTQPKAQTTPTQQPAQPTYTPKTNVSISELSAGLQKGFTGEDKDILSRLGKDSISGQIMTVDIPQLKYELDKGNTYAQTRIDELYNKYVRGGQQTQPQAPAPVAPVPQPQQKVTTPQSAPSSNQQSYQDYYNQDAAEIDKLLAPNQVKRPDEMAVPDILKELSNLTGQQKRSNIATNAVFGGGVDDVSGRYFLNSLLREYLNTENQPTGYDLLPVEEQYLQRFGIPVTSSTDSEDFLRQLGLYYKNLGGL